jgi:hypothetical protein
MKIIMKSLPVCILIILIFISCSTQKEAVKEEVTDIKVFPEKKKYELMAEEKYKGYVDYIPNTDSSFIICINQDKPNAENPFPTLNFCVFSITKDTIIYEESLANGKVYWKNDYQIKVDFSPGQVQNDKEPYQYYIYDLIKKKKYIDVIYKEEKNE